MNVVIHHYEVPIHEPGIIESGGAILDDNLLPGTVILSTLMRGRIPSLYVAKPAVGDQPKPGAKVVGQMRLEAFAVPTGEGFNDGRADDFRFVGTLSHSTPVGQIVYHIYARLAVW